LEAVRELGAPQGGVSDDLLGLLMRVQAAVES
jgi:hypothetical protein